MHAPHYLSRGPGGQPPRALGTGIAHAAMGLARIPGVSRIVETDRAKPGRPGSLESSAMTPESTDARHAAAFARAQQTYAAWTARPSWAAKLVGAVLFFILLGLAALLLLGGLIVGAVIALAAGIYAGIRWLRRRITNPPDQALRRNVRVSEHHFD